MKNRNSYFISTVLLICLITGCSGISNCSVATKYHTTEKIINNERAYSSLSIVNFEFENNFSYNFKI